MLGIGLIGLGTHGRRYARHIVEDLSDARLVAVCRRDRAEGERVAAAYACAYHADYARLVADPRVEAVAIVVPPTLHGSIIEAACRAGKPVLVEKPLAVSLAEARGIARLVATSGIRLMVAHTVRFDSTVQALRASLDQIAPLHALSLSQRFEPSTLPWLDRRAESGGGIVLHTGIHSLDLVRFFTGLEIVEVWCRAGQIVTRETEDSFAMIGRLSDPAIFVTVSGSRAMGGRSGLIELAGARGQLLGDHVHGWAFLVQGRERQSLPVGPPAPTVREALRAFVTGLRSSAPFPVSVDDGVRAVTIVEACYRSAERGGEGVRVEECA